METETKLKRKMYNECIIILGNYQQMAVTKREEGQGTGVVLLTVMTQSHSIIITASNVTL